MRPIRKENKFHFLDIFTILLISKVSLLVRVATKPIEYINIYVNNFMYIMIVIHTSLSISGLEAGSSRIVILIPSFT